MEIPNGIKKIYPFTFYNHYSNKIVIPPSVEEIGTCAFQYNREAKTLVLNEGLKIIGDSAFGDCEDLTGVLHLPHTLQSIGDSAFACNYNITEVTVPGSVKKITRNAFGCCLKLEKVVIEEGVETIDCIFSGCEKLKEVTLPSSLEFVDYLTFRDMYEFAEKINFGGTKSQWKKLCKKDEFKAKPRKKGFKIYCSDGVIK